MKQIERGLCEVHSQFIPNGEGTSRTRPSHAVQTNGYTNGTKNDENVEPQPCSSTNDKSFAVIAFVQMGSPADLAVSLFRFCQLLLRVKI